ncbi:hypothetical protein GCM10025861_16370 [Methanobacterium petrolearium]|nr:hypothetical protein GCM10025861_16370 [Methanobacterium petrolearium]
MAVDVNSVPIEGRAMLMDEATNGVKNEVKIATIKAYLLGEINMNNYQKVISSLKHNYLKYLSSLSDKIYRN